MTQDVPVPEQTEERERRRRPWFLLPWMLLVFLMVFCCGQMALLTQLPASGEDTRSGLSADYQPWAFVPMAPIDPEALLRALGIDGTPVVPLAGCLLLGQDCDGTPTATQTPVPVGPTDTPTITFTPTQTLPPSLTPTPGLPTSTPTVTNTPTQTPTPTPLVHPLKWGSPRDVQPGVTTSVSFTILVINGRSGPATLTRVTDCLPAGMTYVSSSRPAVTNSPGGCEPGETEIVWDLSPSIVLPPGRFYRITMATRADSPAVGEVMQNFVMAEGDFTASSYWTSIYAWTPTPTPVDATPVAVDDNATTNEDAPVTIPVLDNDSGLTNPPLTVAIVATPAYGVATVNGDNTVTYDPDLNYNETVGPESFTYTITDVDGDVSNEATVRITVTSVNDPPVAVAESYAVPEDGSLSVPSAIYEAVLANDADVESPPQVLTAVLGSGPAHAAAFHLNADGSFTYTPRADYRGPDNFTYHAHDGTDDSNTVTVSITVTPVNDVPVLAEDSASPLEDTSVLIGVLANDDLGDDDTLGDYSVSVSVETNASHGSATVEGTSIRYTPSADYRGADSFVYRVTESPVGPGEWQDSLTATVWINVTATNDVPVANPDNRFLAEDPPLPLTINVLTNDDLGNAAALGDQPVHVAIVPSSGPTNGAAIVNGDNTITYTPAANFNGVDTFRYTVTDAWPAPVFPGETSDTSNEALVTIAVTPVNDVPVAVPENYSTAEEVPLIVPEASGVLANDTDPDLADVPPQVLSAVLSAGPAHASPGGFALNPNGSFTYTPAADYRGPDSFAYHANDGLAISNVVTVSLTVTPVDDDPVAVEDPGVTTAEDNPVQIDVLANDSGLGDTPLTLTVETSPAHGSAVPVWDIDHWEIEYTPAANYNDTIDGPDTFTYTITDSAPFGPPEQVDTSAPAMVTVSVTPVNDAPVAAPDSYLAAEDLPLVVLAPGVLSNDSDVDDLLPPPWDTLSAVLDSGPGHGGVTLNADGSFSYTPAPDYYGADSFTYHASDGGLGSNVVTVSITVTPTNDTPDAVDDGSPAAPLETEEDTPLTVTVLANDIGLGDTPLLVTAVDGTSGTVVVNGDNTVTYTPAPDWSGDDNFTYTVTDLDGEFDTATVHVRVLLGNDAPVAVDDSRTVLEDVPPLGYVDIEVVLNDTDVDNPNGDLVVAVGTIGNVQGGTAVLLGDQRTVRFTPTADANNGNTPGAFGFTYRVSDGLLTSLNVGHVTVSVTPVNDTPDAVDDGTPTRLSTPEGTPLTVTVLANDTGLGDTPLGVTATDGANGTVVVNGDNTVTYTPDDPEWNGDDQFTYTVTDLDGESDTASVYVQVTFVNDPPVAHDDSGTVDEDTPSPGVSIDLVANDHNIEQELLGRVPEVDETTVQILTWPANGTLVVNAGPYEPLGPSGAGTVSYTPHPDFRGTDSFTYTVFDFGSPPLESNEATVTITVTPVNDVPVLADDGFPAPLSVLEDDSLLVDVLNNDVLGNDPDMGDYPVSVSVVLGSGPTHGSAVVVGTSIRYTPDLDYNGTDSFVYQVTEDPQGPELQDIRTATVTIAVTPVNDAPVAHADSYAVDEDATLTVGAPGVLGNDTDVDLPPQVLNAVLGTAPGHAAAFHLNADGSFSYTPEADYRGGDSFTYHANDGSLDSSTVTVSLTVTPVNDEPSLVDDHPPAVVEDGWALIHVLANDTLGNDAARGDYPVSVGPTSDPPHGTAAVVGTSILYTPDPDYRGSDSFTYTVTETLQGSETQTTAAATVWITVTPANDVPVLAPDSESTPEETPVLIDVLANDDLGDNDALGDYPVVVSVEGVPTNGSADAVWNIDHWEIRYTPSLNFNGSATFTYRVTETLQGSETQESQTATVTITVTPVNDAPVAVADSYTATEDTPLIVPAGAGVLANDTDPEAPPQVLSAVLDADVSHGLLALNADGSFTYTPEADYRGGDSFTYHASDGSLGSNVMTVSIAVSAEDDQPFASDDSDTTPEDTPVTINVLANDILGNDPHVGDQPVTVAVVRDPLHGGTVRHGDNTITYSPNLNYNDTLVPDSFTYTITDADGDVSNEATVYVTVTPVNDPPVATNDGLFETAEETPLSIAAPGVLANDSDIDVPAQPLTAVLDTGPAHAATFDLNSDGSFTYLPEADYNGPDSFAYRASDGAANSNLATVNLHVTPVNDAPVAHADSYAVEEDATLTVGAPGVLGNDADVDLPPQVLNAVLGTAPAHAAAFSLSADGSFTYTPTFDYYGSDSFTYMANDGSLDSAPATVTITVNPVPPVLFVDAVANQGTAEVGEMGAFFTVAWGNLGPDDAPGAALDVSLAGPCSLISPAFPMNLGTIAEGDGGFHDVTVRADGAGTCQLTATLTSTRSNPAPSSASIDIVSPSPLGLIAGVMSLLGGGEPLPPEPAATETSPGPEPTPTPLVVSQGSLMTDPGSPLAWGILALFGIWFGRLLVFKVHVPAHRTRRSTRYDEPATRPRR